VWSELFEAMDDDAEPQRMLRRARRDIEEQIAALTRDLDDIIEASRSSNADDEHDPEGATIAFERAQVSALLAGAREHLADVDAALARLAAGTYGRCSVCGRPIPPERLVARPSADRCVSCAALR
jgi:RNA polymerase-binding transcription factor DksA